MIAGRTTVGSSMYELVSDTKRAMVFTMAADVMLSKVSAFLDGQGSGAASQPSQAVRAALYDSAGNLLRVSCEVVVVAGQAGSWVDFGFPVVGGLPENLSPAAYQIALVAGGPGSGLIRVYGDDPHGAGGSSNSDVYVDGPSDPFGSATALTADLSAFVTVFAPYSTVRPFETDLYYSRLPFPEAQAVFGMGAPRSGTAQLVQVGWHHTFIDPEMGSNALVRQGGPFESLLGERILITTVGTNVPRRIYAYVHSVVQSSDLDWDISLTRHLFGRITSLSSETVQSTVQVVV